MFLLYGSWEPLNSLKILPRGVASFSTLGKPHPRIFEKSIFSTCFLYSPQGSLSTPQEPLLLRNTSRYLVPWKKPSPNKTHLFFLKCIYVFAVYFLGIYLILLRNMSRYLAPWKKPSPQNTPDFLKCIYGYLQYSKSSYTIYVCTVFW